VASILVEDHAARGVRTVDGTEYRAKVVVSNANAYDTFHKMMDEREYLKDHLARLDGFSVSLSSFQGFLGLKKDLIREVGTTDSEIFCETGYDSEENYNIAGEKKAYRAEKERMADVLIRRVEAKLLPGLSKAIEVKEIGTPLTNVRCTRNYRGAIYGWDETLENSMPRRLSQRTPINNLYLAGAWTQPGHGYGAVIPSGLQCFATIMGDWGRA